MTTNELLEKWLRDDPRTRWQSRSLEVTCGFPAPSESNRVARDRSLHWYATLTVGSESFEAGGKTEAEAIHAVIRQLAYKLDGQDAPL